MIIQPHIQPRMLCCIVSLLGRLSLVPTIVIGCSSTVEPDTTSRAVLVIVTPPTSTLTLGGTFPLQAQAQDASGQLIPTATFFWSSSDTAIVTVSDVGVVHARALGTAEISANAEGKFALATVTVVSVLAPVARVVVAPAIATVAKRKSVDLSARLYDQDDQEIFGRSITWSSSDMSIATVSATGAFTANVQAKNKTGKATITATSEGKEGTMQVTVSILGL